MDAMRFLATDDPFEAELMYAVANRWLEMDELRRDDQAVRNAREVWRPWTRG